MGYVVMGLEARQFEALKSLSTEDLAAKGVKRVRATAKPGFPCRISLEDAEPGEDVLLLNFESHAVDTPYRSSFAIYVRQAAERQARFENALPPVMQGRPIALRIFSADGMLIGADMGMDDELTEKIEAALKREGAAYLHAHNAMHGCFVAEIRPN